MWIKSKYPTTMINLNSVQSIVYDPESDETRFYFDAKTRDSARGNHLEAIDDAFDQGCEVLTLVQDVEQLNQHPTANEIEPDPETDGGVKNLEPGTRVRNLATGDIGTVVESIDTCEGHVRVLPDSSFMPRLWLISDLERLG